MQSWDPTVVSWGMHRRINEIVGDPIMHRDKSAKKFDHYNNRIEIIRVYRKVQMMMVIPT